VLRRCVWSRNIKNRCSIYIYIYIYDISSLSVNDLTLILLTWRKWWTPNNATKWQMGFNSAFKVLTIIVITYYMSLRVQNNVVPWHSCALFSEAVRCLFHIASIVDDWNKCIRRYWGNNTKSRMPKFSEGKLFRCHFIHHNPTCNCLGSNTHLVVTVHILTFFDHQWPRVKLLFVT